MKKTTLTRLDIFTPVTVNNVSTYKQAYNEDFDIDNFLHFPVITNNDGSLWKHGNLYLLSKLKNYTKPSPKTLDSIATDLKYFKQWCNNEDIDYLSAARKVTRPTYLYRSHLQNLLKNGKISPHTIKRRMGAVVNFYRYLIESEDIEFKYPLWETGIASISYLNAQGFKQYKEVVTTDVGRVVATSNPDLFDDVIEDGGRLHPIPQEKQKVLFRALKNIENIEMTLGFLIALTTGARIQTVYTLRLKHFNKKPTEGKKEMTIKVGYGTDCDTKNQKLHALNMPTWVYNKIRIYLNSPRALKRRNKAKHIFDTEEHQYTFLTVSGRPYYAAYNDPYRVLYTEVPNGGGIRQFIFGTLKNKLLKDDDKIDFSFHDLRASFGMNLLDKLMPLVQAKEITLTFALNIVKEQMGHSSLLTTERYLNFRDRHKIKEQAQDNFETFLMDLIDE